MTVSVVHRAELGRYEVQVAGRAAGFAEYTDLCGVRVFTGGKVDPEFEGHGLGSALLAAVLESERRAGNLIQARCAFMRRFIERNPQYRDLVAANAAVTPPRRQPTSRKPATASRGAR